MIGITRKIFCCSILSLALFSLSISLGQHSVAQTTKTAKLTVKITGIRNSEGNIRVVLRSGESTIVNTKVVAIDPKTLAAEAVFDNLPEGTYGVGVIHDENKNGKLDFNEMGMPTEGYGHSNNPEKRPAPPSFDETKFTLTAPGSTSVITLIYW